MGGYGPSCSDRKTFSHAPGDGSDRKDSSSCAGLGRVWRELVDVTAQRAKYLCCVLVLYEDTYMYEDDVLV